jgi:hypothetical protein
MSDQLNQLEEQIKTIQAGLFKMGPERIRALSTHETDDLLVELAEVAEKAMENVQALKK